LIIQGFFFAYICCIEQKDFVYYIHCLLKLEIMSIINSDGLNTNWQLNVLRGLQGIIDELNGTVNVNVTTASAGLSRIPILLRSTGYGIIIPVVYSISVSNVGTANGTFIGGIVKPGETLNFDAGALNNFYSGGMITFDGTGTELVIIYNK
jgi:hypothetical protein